MTTETEITTLAIRSGTHRLLREYADANGLKLYFVVDQAIREYIANHTRPDFAHVAADSDPITEGGDR